MLECVVGVAMLGDCNLGRQRYSKLLYSAHITL